MKIRTINLLLILSRIVFFLPDVEAQPTLGWTQVPYTYSIQSPYNLPTSARFWIDSTFSAGAYVDSMSAYNFFVVRTDAPYSLGSSTLPRTEMRLQGNDYDTVDQHQFEADFYVPTGTDSTCIMQIFGGGTSSTALQLRVYNVSGNGNLYAYTVSSGNLVLANCYNQWHHLNVTHNSILSNDSIKIYIDYVLAKKTIGRGYPTSPTTSNSPHYFKCGVYNQDKYPPVSDTNRVKYKNIKVWYLSNTVTGISKNNLSPSSALVLQNYPNPFNPSTMISYETPVTDLISVKIFDLLGREIATLVNEKKQAGKYQVTWDASRFMSGVYFCRLQAGASSVTKKLLYVK
jgi:Alginate lyase/Secretion system C-terminal sorting domain